MSHLPGEREAFPGVGRALVLNCPFLSTTGVSSAIFFVPGVLLLVPGGESDEVWWGTGRVGPGPFTDRPHPIVYHVIFIYCAVKGHRGFQFFYLPYFEK